MYVKLQFYGCNDQRFNAYNFDIQPIDFVLKTLTVWEKIYTNHLNLHSKTEAIGWTWLINGFNDTNKINHHRLLPVQFTENLEVNEGYNTPTEETLTVLKRVLSLNRVPKKVMLGLISTGILRGM